jgi:hypothetical protein
MYSGKITVPPGGGGIVLLSLIFIKNYLLELFIIKIVTAAAGTPMNTANYTFNCSS